MQTWILVAIAVLLLLIFGGGILAAASGSSNNNSNSCGSRNNVCSGGAKYTSEPQLVLFYTTWCGYCKMIKPAWERLQNEFPSKVIGIDADKLPDLKNAFGARGYPSIFWAPRGLANPNVAEEYNSGKRDYKSLKAFLNSKL